MEPQSIIITWKKMEPGTREGLIIFAALVGVIGLVLLWAVFLRKPRRQHHHHSHHHSRAEDGSDTADSTSSPKRRKWRRRRRDHRPRNPTLAETGGLPPLRSDGPPPPSLDR
jgi:ABC-type nickel/cobalt efflux system permease component RcnA